MTTSVLDDGVFPIVGWAGPSKEMIRDDVMAGMREAGFTVSHSQAGEATDEVVRALDTAHAAGVRLLLGHPSWSLSRHRGAEGTARVSQARKLIEKIREHPGLYGYSIQDEPVLEHIPALAEITELVRSLDPCHPAYINHHPQTWHCGAFTLECFWREFIEKVRPPLLSFDHYPVTVETDEQIAATRHLPNVFARHKIVVKPDFFEALAVMRNLSVAHGLPFWAFTCSTRHGSYPTPTEGHMRFQLFNNLAYGARGLQYFTYAHSDAMVRSDGSTTETWELARRINADIHGLAPILTKLRSVGVYHNGTPWSGTRTIRGHHTSKGVCVTGDQVTVGFFVHEDGQRFAMVVNVNPCDWARVSLRVCLEGESLYCVDPRDGQPKKLWPVNPADQMVVLAPGEGRLFQIRADEDGA